MVKKKKSSLTLTILLLAVSDYRSSFGSGSVILDDCNFHESVRLDNFDLDRTLTLVSETKATWAWKAYVDWRGSIYMFPVS